MSVEIPQALEVAGLSVERQEHGARLIVRDTLAASPESCAIRSRAGEALAGYLAQESAVKALDLQEANMTDNSVGHVCLKLRETDQLDELLLGSVGHAGLSFLIGAVECCEKLQSLKVRVSCAPTIHVGRQTTTEFDTSGYTKPPKKEGEPESEGEEEENQAEEGDDDEPEERARKKAEALKAAFRVDDYDSEDEEHINAQAASGAGVAAAPAAAAACPPAKKPQHAGTVAAAGRALLELFVQAVAARENLLAVDCDGEFFPRDLLLDLERAVARHREARDKRLHAAEERGAHTARDALREQLQELQQPATASGGVASALGGAEQVAATLERLGIRSFVSRRLFMALGEALFECQRYKSKDNEAVMTPEGEMAFIAMYLRRHARLEAAREVTKR